MENYEMKLREGVGREKQTIHTIKVPTEHPKGGWYRQVTSISALLGRASKRWYYHWHEKHYFEFPHAIVRFHRYDPVQEKCDKEVREKFGIERDEPELITHESVWDFYEYIGYNHKDKRVGQIDKLLILNNGK